MSDGKQTKDKSAELTKKMQEHILFFSKMKALLDSEQNPDKKSRLYADFLEEAQIRFTACHQEAQKLYFDLQKEEKKKSNFIRNICVIIASFLVITEGTYLYGQDYFSSLSDKSVAITKNSTRTSAALLALLMLYTEIRNKRALKSMANATTNLAKAIKQIEQKRQRSE